MMLVLSTFSILIPAERDIKYLLGAIAVSLILILTHIKKRHLNFKKYDKLLLVAVFLMAFEAFFIKKLYPLDKFSNILENIIKI